MKTQERRWVVNHSNHPCAACLRLYRHVQLTESWGIGCPQTPEVGTYKPLLFVSHSEKHYSLKLSDRSVKANRKREQGGAGDWAGGLSKINTWLLMKPLATK